MNKTADSYRFSSGITKRMIKTWIGMEKPRDIPWTPLARPLADATVVLVSTAGIALKTDRPFDPDVHSVRTPVRDGRQHPFHQRPIYGPPI